MCYEVNQINQTISISSIIEKQNKTQHNTYITLRTERQLH